MTARFDGKSDGELPTVAVVVPIYNGERDVPVLVEQLLGQDYPAERVSFWLVDNGSCDRTPDLLAAAAARSPQLQVLSYRAVQSSYAARNAGVEASASDIVAFTDADCVPDPDWLRQLVQPFADAAVGLVAGEILALPGHSWLERYAERQNTLSQKNTLSHPFYPYGQTANLAVRRKIFAEVGLFRPHLSTGGDADFCWRVQQQSPWQLVLAEQAVIRHRHRQSLGELRRQWYRYGCSNRYLHELHGVALQRPLTAGEVRYRLVRWLGKELPARTLGWLRGRDRAIDLAVTPIDLICFAARSRGQQEAQLPEAARTIATLEEVR